MNFTEVKLYNPGILEADTPTDIFTEIYQSCEIQIKNKDVGTRMRRNMMTDFGTQGLQEVLYANITPKYKNFLEEFAKEYAKYFKMATSTMPQVHHGWINLQKKFEYRPAHQHSDGVGHSIGFVTYIRVPYDLAEEDKYPNHNNKAKIYRNGRIEFFYNLLNGPQFTHRLNIDKSYVGKTIMFSNSLMHCVYPFFTSDDYRISLAGNIIL